LFVKIVQIYQQLTLEELSILIANPLIQRIQNSKGLSVFSANRSKFEGWLKVELIEILVANDKPAKPEVGRVDVTFDDIAIELKTVNTNFRTEKAENKHRPITKNIKGVISDIHALKNNCPSVSFVIFICFPLTHENPKWKFHLLKIENELEELLHTQFSFENQIPGVLYFGRAK
jgi:hypothetical protein